MTDADLTALARRRSLPPCPERARLRKAAGLTLSGMAVYVQVHRTSITEWEAGRVEPLGQTRERYARVLHALAAAERPEAQTVPLL